MISINNYSIVSRELSRGARPSLAAIKEMYRCGYKTIIDLEAFFDFNLVEWIAVKSAGMIYSSIPCSPWHPEIEDVVAFLKIVTDPARQPCFVHCRQGSDRTGMMVAIYRIAVQGWNKPAAIIEMVNGGFGFHGQTWPQIVPFVAGLDISKVRQK